MNIFQLFSFKREGEDRSQLLYSIVLVDPDPGFQAAVEADRTDEDSFLEAKSYYERRSVAGRPSINSPSRCNYGCESRPFHTAQAYMSCKYV